MVSSMVRAVLSAKMWSSCSLSLVILIAKSVGTFVKSETTSKYTRISSPSRCWLIKVMKLLELLM